MRGITLSTNERTAITKGTSFYQIESHAAKSLSVVSTLRNLPNVEMECFTMRLLSLALTLAAAPAAANDVSGAFAQLVELASTYGEEITGQWCSDVVCNGQVGSDTFQMMWPEGGWVWIEHMPAARDAQSNLIFCTIVIDYATGLGPEGAGVLAGRLFGEKDARVDIGTAEIRARKSPSGLTECEARLPRPL